MQEYSTHLHKLYVNILLSTHIVDVLSTDSDIIFTYEHDLTTISESLTHAQKSILLVNKLLSICARQSCTRPEQILRTECAITTPYRFPTTNPQDE